MKALLLLLAAAARPATYSDWHRFEKNGVVDGHAAKGTMYITGAVASEPASDNPHKPWLMITCSTRLVFLDFYAGVAPAPGGKASAPGGNEEPAGTLQVQFDAQSPQAIPVTWHPDNKSATLSSTFLKSLFGPEKLFISFSGADGKAYTDTFHIGGLPRDSVAKDCGKENVD